MIIWDWVMWFFHIVFQTILYYIPLVKPLVEPLLPPPFFLECEDFYYDWPLLLDEEQRPTIGWIEAYWPCIWRILLNRIDDRILALVDLVMHYVVFAVGTLPAPFITIPEWLSAIRGWIGEILPDWATDIASGLVRLWELIPEPIRDGLLTWAEFMAGAPEAILAWIEEAIGDFLAMLQEIWDWYVGLAQFVVEWWQWAHDQLDELISDAYGWIVRTLGAAWAFLVWFWSNPTAALASWLSPWWGQLVTFATDCLDFWYNIWGSYAGELAAFLADPLDFLWNIGEDWLNARLERS